MRLTATWNTTNARRNREACCPVATAPPSSRSAEIVFVWSVWQHRRQAEEDPASGCHRKGESEDATVQTEVDGFRNSREVQERRAPIGKHDAAETSQQRQQHGFRQPLANEARVSGADRHAYGHLATAGHAAGEQQAGDVGARDEQHEEHGCAEQPEQRA